jgi:hypothetical protein
LEGVDTKTNPNTKSKQTKLFQNSNKLTIKSPKQVSKSYLQTKTQNFQNKLTPNAHTKIPSRPSWRGCSKDIQMETFVVFVIATSMLFERVERLVLAFKSGKQQRKHRR